MTKAPRIRAGANSAAYMVTVADGNIGLNHQRIWIDTYLWHPDLNRESGGQPEEPAKNA